MWSTVAQISKLGVDVSVGGRGGWDVGCFTQNVHLNVEFFPPSCGVLFAKRGGGGDGGVAVWEQLVCDPPMWPACCWERWQLLKEQVTKATVVAMEAGRQWRWFGLSVGVWGGVVRYVHGDYRQMHGALVPTRACGFLRLSQRERTPEVCFSNMPECKRLVRDRFWECRSWGRCV